METTTTNSGSKIWNIQVHLKDIRWFLLLKCHLALFWANKHIGVSKMRSSDWKCLCLVWALDWLMCVDSFILFCVSSQTVTAMQITRTQDISLHNKYSVTRLRVMKETSIIHYWNCVLALILAAAVLLSAPLQKVRRLLSLYTPCCFYVFDVCVCVCDGSYTGWRMYSSLFF